MLALRRSAYSGCSSALYNMLRKNGDIITTKTPNTVEISPITTAQSPGFQEETPVSVMCVVSTTKLALSTRVSNRGTNDIMLSGQRINILLGVGEDISPHPCYSVTLQ